MKESKVVRRPLIVDEPFVPRVMHGFSELLAGIDPAGEALPPLGGMVMTSAKPNPNVLVPLVRSTDDGDDPVLAHWQYELGRTVAFTSGYWPRWGRDWTQWPKFAKLWAQIVRWTMRQDTPANFDTYTKVEGNQGRIIIDALDKDAGYLNMLQLRARVVGPDQKAIPVRFTQTGPGHYEARIDIERAGQYLANVRVFDAEGRSMGTIRTGFSVPFSPEYRDLSPNEALLRQVAEISGGRWLDLPAEEANVFSHDLPPTKSRRPAWAWVLAWLLLPAFLLDVAVRRLASWLALSIAVEIVVLVVLLFGLNLRYAPWWGILGALLLAELIGWTIRFRYIAPLFEFLTHGVTALGQAGDRSAVALEKLRSTRDRVRDGLDAAGDEAAIGPQDAADSVTSTMAKRRFEADPESITGPAGDLEDALGGGQAPSAEPRGKKPDGTGKADASEDHSTTSRLLRAKRRSQEDQKKE